MTTRPPENQLDGNLPVEIERKYLLRGMPAFPSEAHVEIWRIEQGYLTPDPKEPLSEGRLRRVRLPNESIECFHTIKRGIGVVRQEIEQQIPPAEFDRNWPRTKGARLRKVRHRIASGDLVWEIDVFEGIDLVLAEVELPAPDARVAWPAWLKSCLVREVTDDPEYTNASIARRLKDD